MSKDILDKYAAPAPEAEPAERGQVASKEFEEAARTLAEQGVTAGEKTDERELGDLPRPTTPGQPGTDGRPPAPSVVEKYAAPEPDRDNEKQRDLAREEPDRG